MTAPMKVQIVRPRRSVSDSSGALIGLVGEWFLTAWFVMLLVPNVINWHPGYWTVMAAMFVVRGASVPPRSLDLWSSNPTKAPRR